MRGPKKQAIVCRTENGLVEKVEDVSLIRDKYPILRWPLIRGCVTFIESMVKGMQALTYSASLIPLEDQEEPDKLDQWIEAHFPGEKAQKLIIGVAVVLGIALSVFLFIFLPALIVGFIKPLTQSYLIRNLAPADQSRDTAVVHVACLAYKGHQASLFLSRRGAQDHLLL